MADSFTTNLGLTKPDVGASDDTWGGKLNNNFDILDSAIGAGSSGSGGARVITATLPPVDAHNGDLWWESDTGILYIYFNDGTSSQWVTVESTTSGGGIHDAPIDGTSYSRKDGGWTPVPPNPIPDAPSDTWLYGRQNAGWSKIGFLQNGSGAVLRTLQDRMSDIVSVKDFGAKGDGTTDDTAAIQNAINYTAGVGKALIFPAGVYVTRTLTAVAKMCLIGENPVTSVIKLKDGTNSYLLTSGSSHEINDIILSGIGFDGNAANNTAADCITIYGNRPIFRNITVLDSAGTAISTLADGADQGRDFASIGYFQDIIIESSQGHGWYFAGPNDSQFDNIIIIDPGLRADNTYYGFYATGSGNGRFNHFHGWNRGPTNISNTMFYMGTSGNNVINSHFEAGYLPLNVQGTANIISGHFYAPRGAVAVLLGVGGNMISGSLGAGAFAGNPNYKGIDLRSGNNIIDVIDMGCINGAIDFAADTGQNFVRVTGSKSSGVAIAGTPHASDDVKIAIAGAGGMTFDQRPGIAWTPYTPSVHFSTAGTPTFGVVTGRYKLDGKSVAVEMTIQVTAVGGAAGALIASLPFPAAANCVIPGRDAGATGKMLQGFANTTDTTIAISDYTGLSGPGVTGAVIVMSGVYERT